MLIGTRYIKQGRNISLEVIYKSHFNRISFILLDLIHSIVLPIFFALTVAVVKTFCCSVVLAASLYLCKTNLNVFYGFRIA